MKTKLAFVCVTLVLTIFTVLYFTNPRTVEVERFIETVIQDTVRVAFSSSAPDTVYKIMYAVEEAEPVQADWNDWEDEELWMTDSTLVVPAFVSEKTFHKDLLLGNVRSAIRVVSPEEVFSIQNTITLIPDKDKINNLFHDQIERQKKSSFKTGLLLGVSGTSVLLTALLLLLN